MHVVVNFLANFRELSKVPKATVEVRSPYIIDVIESLGEMFGESLYSEIIDGCSLREDAIILHNGNITYNLEEKIEEGDELTLLPPAFGG